MSHRTTYRLWYTGISELLSSSKSKKTEDLADQTTACLDNFPGFLMSLLLSRSFQKGTHETWVFQHMATPVCLQGGVPTTHQHAWAGGGWINLGGQWAAQLRMDTMWQILQICIQKIKLRPHHEGFILYVLTIYLQYIFSDRDYFLNFGPLDRFVWLNAFFWSTMKKISYGFCYLLNPIWNG